MCTSLSDDNQDGQHCSRDEIGNLTPSWLHQLGDRKWSNAEIEGNWSSPRAGKLLDTITVRTLVVPTVNDGLQLEQVLQRSYVLYMGE